MAMNLASKYSNKVDERFYRDSQVLIATNKDYEWTGVNSINVYQIDTVPMTDYTRTGSNRYGNPTELGNTIKSYTITRDRGFTFTIDKGNKTQTMMVMDAGKSLARQQREVIIPEFDTYVFAKMAGGAIANGHLDMAAASTSTAYAKFLKGQEVLGNKNVPDVGRVAFCSYAFCNLLMQDPAFIKYSDKSQEMVIKGILGEVDGIKIVKVPASRLPYGTSFLIVHPSATVAPEQLKEYKTHDCPPGISGWLVEGRMIYDAFILEGKKDALYLGMCEGVLGTLTVKSVEGEASGKTVLSYSGLNIPIGSKIWYKAASGTAPSAGSYGNTFDGSGWTEYTSEEVTLTDGYKFTIAVAVNNKLLAAGSGTVDAKA